MFSGKIGSDYGCALTGDRLGIDKKNEVFGGSSTRERAPPAVLVAECYNLPISSTNLKLLT